MAANQLFADWVTGDLITADKLNQMKNDLVPWAKAGVADGIATLDGDGMVVDSDGHKIVESGSNSNGNWIKYADGTMICWHTLEKTGLAVNIAVGNWYRSPGGQVKWMYPVEYAATPTVTASIVEVSGVDLVIGPFSGTLLTKTEANPLILKSTSGSVDLKVMFVAIGRWS